MGVEKLNSRDWERSLDGLYLPFFDPHKSYEENYRNGPFGVFADGEKFEQTGQPGFTVLGREVYLPFGIPPGPLLNSNYVISALDKGFDIAVYKTVRTRARVSNDHFNVLAVHTVGDLTLEMAEEGLLADSNYVRPLSITNSFGVPSMDPDVWQPDLKRAVDYAGVGQMVIGGFQGTTGEGEREYVEDFVRAAKMVKDAGAHALEANLSCPNEGVANLLCFDLPRVEEIVKEIKSEIGNTPLIIKIAYFPDQAQLIDLVARVGSVVEGIAAINTIPAKIYNSEGSPALPGKNRLVSGVCGEPIRWAGLEMTRRLKQIRENGGFDIEIFGVGGVVDSSGYLAYRQAGADVVMSATGAMWKPYLAQEIKQNFS